MDYLVMGAQLILALSILVVLHEFGHYIPAKLFKTRVEKFYLFFDPWFSLFKRKIGETEWGIGWLPLGGYVKISGMVDESMDKEQLAQEPQPWEFRSKPAWQRLIIMIGGVLVNLIVGFVIYAMVLFFWGQDVVTNKTLHHGFMVSQNAQNLGFQNGDKILTVDGEILDDVLDVNKHLMLRSVKEIKVQHLDNSEEVISIPEDFGYTMWGANDLTPFSPRTIAYIDTLPGRLAAKSGLIKGDLITKVNGTPITYYDEFLALTKDSSIQEANVTISRDGKEMNFDLIKDSTGLLGFSQLGKFGEHSYDINHIDYSFGNAVSKGFSFGYWTLHDYAAQFKYVFTKKGATSVGGFGAIAKMFPPVWDWKVFWLNTALISIILAFMNILPIPALDGGHVVFLLYEMVTGREAPQKVLEYAQYAGFILLMGLLLYANGNDIYKWITG